MLGYDIVPSGGRLMVNDKESRRVRDIFALFVQHQSLSAVVAELARRRWKTKSWTAQNGRAHTGRDFAKASLRRLLTNAIYAGKVEHRGAIYAGEQAFIVEPSVWQVVDAELRVGRRAESGATRVPQNALLAGLVHCKSCQRPMIPTYTAKPGRRYRYYVCRAARQNGWSSCPTKSVPARMIEDAVLDQLRTALRDSGSQHTLQSPNKSPVPPECGVEGISFPYPWCFPGLLPNPGSSLPGPPLPHHDRGGRRWQVLNLHMDREAFASDLGDDCRDPGFLRRFRKWQHVVLAVLHRTSDPSRPWAKASLRTCGDLISRTSNSRHVVWPNPRDKTSRIPGTPPFPNCSQGPRL